MTDKLDFDETKYPWESYWDHPDFSLVMQKLKQLCQAIDGLREELLALKQEQKNQRTREFKERFERPFK